ncbi:uncharacterized protein LOC133036245 [Cannabis sativa]|uniref:uncharacterized protein LOC133036245 n=1 Tax=Cannabis sativa TaxID=3483 RepID=UPI0029CAA4DA|nr:uncharacterized protein LOC133036245 [Cannabis sativa]
MVAEWLLRGCAVVASDKGFNQTMVVGVDPAGVRYTLELLYGSNRQCIELMWMSRDAFVLLCNHFRQREWIKDSKNVSIEEKIAIFLTIIAHNERFIVMKRRFQHSSQIVHKYFHEVLEEMMHFAKEMIVSTVDFDSNIPTTQKNIRKFFKGAICALDGTLVHAIIPLGKQIAYRGRGKGWEGVAHDSRVLKEIVANPNNCFQFPPPRDYHRRRAVTKEEKFNHAHAQLRNVIERSFGVLKSRFPILDKMAPYEFHVQRDVVIACFAINNFIRKDCINDELFNQFDQPQVIFEEGLEEQIMEETNEPSWRAEDAQFMNNLRNELSLKLMQRRGNN